MPRVVKAGSSTAPWESDPVLEVEAELGPDLATWLGFVDPTQQSWWFDERSLPEDKAVKQ